MREMNKNPIINNAVSDGKTALNNSDTIDNQGACRAAHSFVEQLRAKITDAVIESLGSAYDCTRTWSAWGHGTMSQDDFSLVAEDGERVAEIVEAVMTTIADHIPASTKMTETAEGAEPVALGDSAAHRIRVWLKAQANAEKDSKARAAFVEAHNAALSIIKDHQSAEKPAVPDGHVIVPKEPTPQMVKLALPWLAHWQHMRKTDREGAIREAYRAMLSATPAQEGGK